MTLSIFEDMSRDQEPSGSLEREEIFYHSPDINLVWAVALQFPKNIEAVLTEVAPKWNRWIPIGFQPMDK